ncbi:MAG: acyl-ACP--UDP-N-acetylglucosamine O-acyltransferase [Kiritimatiellae bacterium]|nr:acyl-ACP--UDP-N-acetylglucosamine O-acyltransferase [Kiritimatiellia bacterium]
MTIHAAAVVDAQAKIGENVTIGPFASIAADVEIGDGCTIGPHVTVLPYTSLGANCRVHAGAVLGDLPQDTAFQQNRSYLRIGANCLIREYVTLHRGTKPESVTEIGDGCFLMGLSHCAHNVKLGPNVIIANGALLGGYVEVGERAFISGNCMLHQFVRVGRLAMLAGGSGVSQDVPPFCTTHGVSANTVSGMNVVGMRRAGFSPQQRAQIKQAFKLLYQAGLNVSQAVDQMRRTFADGPAREFAEFVAASKRGVCAFIGGASLRRSTEA